MYQRLPVYLDTRPLVSQPAPDFYLPTLADEGRPVRLSDYRGKKVLLNFWATWCGPCVREVPDLAEIHAELPCGRARILRCCRSRRMTRPPYGDFAREHEIRYPIVFDPRGEAHELYKVSLFPTMVWIDEEGRVESFSHGMDYILKYKIRHWVTGGIFEAAP